MPFEEEQGSETLFACGAVPRLRLPPCAQDLLPSVEVSAAVLHAASSLHYQSQQNGMHVHAPALVGRIGTAAGSSALQLAIEPKAPGTNRIPGEQLHKNQSCNRMSCRVSAAS